jgi:hypothetical protein
MELGLAVVTYPPEEFTVNERPALSQIHHYTW